MAANHLIIPLLELCDNCGLLFQTGDFYLLSFDRRCKYGVKIRPLFITEYIANDKHCFYCNKIDEQLSFIKFKEVINEIISCKNDKRERDRIYYRPNYRGLIINSKSDPIIDHIYTRVKMKRQLRNLKQKQL